jgi:hypothetical protein
MIISLIIFVIVGSGTCSDVECSSTNSKQISNRIKITSIDIYYIYSIIV